MNKITKLFI